jgi:hypothetical protein
MVLGCGCEPFAAGQKVVCIARMWSSDRRTLQDAVRLLAVARKLAGILHRMWISETDFQVGFGAKVTQG